MNEKRQAGVANTKMSQVLELCEKNFRVAIMKILQSIANSLERNEKIENISKEIQIIKIPNGNGKTKILVTKVF